MLCRRRLDLLDLASQRRIVNMPGQARPHALLVWRGINKLQKVPLAPLLSYLLHHALLVRRWAKERQTAEEDIVLHTHCPLHQSMQVLSQTIPRKLITAIPKRWRIVRRLSQCKPICQTIFNRKSNNSRRGVWSGSDFDG
jgi:hypothetical protein